MATFPRTSKLVIEDREVEVGPGVENVTWNGHKYEIHWAPTVCGTLDDVIAAGGLVEPPPLHLDPESHPA